MTPRGLRNRNPGNLVASPWAQKQPGYAGLEGEGRFATYATMAYGVAAAISLLKVYRGQGKTTLRQIVMSWAPPNENNSVAYWESMSRWLGLGPDDQIPDAPNWYVKVAEAIFSVENGRDEASKAISDADYSRALEIAGLQAPETVRAQETEPALPAPVYDASGGGGGYDSSTVDIKGNLMPEGEISNDVNQSNNPINVGATVQAAAPLLSLLNPLLGVAASALPQIAGIVFDKTNTVPERNIKIATSVLNTIQTATGAPTHAEAVARVVDDPTARAAAAGALRPFFEMSEVGGGVAAARDFAVKMDTSGKAFYESAVFWMSLIFLAPVYALVADFLFVHPEQWKGDIRIQIATALLTIISLVGAVWFGTNIASKSKDATIQQLAQK